MSDLSVRDIRGTSAWQIFLGFVLLSLALTPSALAGPPAHLRNASLDIGGFNHACGTATDSQGDIYVSSAGAAKVEVFGPDGEHLASISDSHEPCGLAVNGKGEVFVSEKALGVVVRYTPDGYPLSGAPLYGPAEVIDESGNAAGIAIDRHDDRLYVAEGDRIQLFSPDGTKGIDEVQRVQVSSFVTGGEFKLLFESKETKEIQWDASNAEIAGALEEIVGAGNIAVSDGPAGANEHLVTFTGALSGTDVTAMSHIEINITGGGLIATETLADGFSGQIGSGELTDATGVAAYTYKGSGNDLYLFAADAATDRLLLFNGSNYEALKLRREISGPQVGEDFGFGAAGAYLAIDPGNRGGEEKCASVAEQACTAGHLLVYDESHNSIDEFDAAGEFLDRFSTAALSDATPTALAVERSGGANDGTIYVTSGAGAGAKLFAFGPLAPPNRAPLPALSHVLKSATAVATDSHGDVYVAAGSLIHVFDPTGAEIKVGPVGKGFEDPNFAVDMAVDSAGKVYVVDLDTEEATYYTPSDYPPEDGTTYARREPSLYGNPMLPLTSVAVDPSTDHVFVTEPSITQVFDSAASGHESKLLNPCFACSLPLGFRASIGVYGDSGNVYVANGGNQSLISVVNGEGTEVTARITGAGGPEGKFSVSPFMAVDQSNGHILQFQPGEAAHEYDASGGFVAEFGKFTEGFYDVAVDSACAVHDPPLSESTTPTCQQYDPANGTVYVVTSATATKGTFNVTAFGPLSYGEAPLTVTGTPSGLGSGDATLSGTVNPRSFDLTECKFDYLTDAQYVSNGKTFAGAISAPCAETLGEIGKGSAPVTVHADISGLDPGTRYRFRLVGRNKYGESVGEAGLFGPPLLTPSSALPILYDEATLRSQIDPSGLATRYHFEYGASESYGQSTPVGELPGGGEAVAVKANLAGLAEGTTYHFRILAENEAQTVLGPDQTLVTLIRRTAESCPNPEYRTSLSANLPDCRAYELVTPAETNGFEPVAPSVGGSGSGKEGFNNWLTPPRGGAAGERLTYFTPGTLPGFNGNGNLDGYRAQRGPGAHPGGGWTSTLVGPTYQQAVPDFFHNPNQLSVASDQLYSFWRVKPAESFAETLEEGVYLRTVAGFELVGHGTLGADPKAEGDYVSPGGAHVIFFSKSHLEDEAAPEGTEALYDRAAGSEAAKVVSLKADGSSFGATENATYVGATEDGSAIVFRVGGGLYLRRGNAETVQVAASPSTFAGISEDGGRVFYAASANGAAPANLFACDVEAGSCAGPEAAQEPTQIAPNSIFVNVSSDGSSAFFTSEEALGGSEPNENGEEAEAGKRNLYAWDRETEAIRFVSQLAAQDFAGFGGSINMTLGSWAAAINPGSGFGRLRSPARSTPDGELFVFQSHARLTSYDNEGQGGIYRYDPAAGVGERLICVSCDPSGAPPGADAMLADIQGGVSMSTVIPNVTDDGQRVFFQSSDRLLPEDANDVLDVYEWKAKGTGGCTRAGGCLALISSGQGERDSFLYSMTPDGRNVFFRTEQKLVGEDIPGSSSIYDARVDGGIPNPPEKAPCEGDACQGAGSTPPVISSPASATIKSQGNASGEDGSRCAKGQRKVRRGGKTRCVVNRKKRHHKHRRANRNRRATR